METSIFLNFQDRKGNYELINVIHKTYIRRRILESPILYAFIKDGAAPSPVVHCPVTSINIQSSIAPGARRRVKHQDVEHFSQAPQCAIQARTPQYVTFSFLYKNTR